MIIGVHGQKGSGKDELFKIFKSLNSTYKKVAFADPIKDEFLKIFGLDEADYDYFKRSTITYDDREIEGRKIVRGIGMLMRGYDDEQFNRRVHDFCVLNKNVVVTDVRFDNEYNMLHKEDAVLIKIKRELPSDEHVTEVEMPDEMFEIVIENNGTLEELTNKIKQIYKDLHDTHTVK